MVRRKYDNIVYYFEKEIHYQEAKDKGYGHAYLEMAMVAVDTNTNRFLKCRYDLVEVCDKLMLAGVL